MGYTLVGNHFSHFVRRVRLIMEDIPYELKVMDIFSPEGHAEIHQVNPIHQIPVLFVDTQPIFDSRVIFNYLNQKHRIEDMTVDKENMLTVIEGLMNAGVAYHLLVKRSGIAANAEVMYLKRQIDRMNSTFEWLIPFMASPAAKEWNVVTKTLYCALDWCNFRQVEPLSNRPESLQFLALHAQRPSVQATDPRRV